MNHLARLSELGSLTDVKQYCRKHLTFIARGTHRTVYDAGEFVVKIPNYHGCRYHIKSEAKVYNNNAGTNHGQHLAPIVYAHPNHLMLFQVKAEPFPVEDVIPQCIIDTAKKLCIQPTEVYHKNLGYLNGQPVIIDYSR